MADTTKKATSVDTISSSFESDITTGHDIKGALTDFISNNKLQGQMWNSVITKLKDYEAAFSKFETRTSNFQTVLNDSIKKIDGCLEEYRETGNTNQIPKTITASETTTITTKITTIKNELEVLRTDLATANAAMSAVSTGSKKVTKQSSNKTTETTATETTDSNTKSYTGRSPYAIQGDITAKEKELKELEAYQTVINKLLDLKKQAEKAIKEEYENIQLLKNEIDKIIPSEKFTLEM